MSRVDHANTTATRLASTRRAMYNRVSGGSQSGHWATRATSLIKQSSMIVMLFALAACSPPPAESNNAKCAADAAKTNTVAPAPAETPVLLAASTEPTAPFSLGIVVVRGDGVSLIGGKTLKFGSAQQLVIDTLTDAFDMAPSNRERLEDCGPGAIVLNAWENGFSAYFHYGAFHGWSTVDQKSPEGIGFGSSRAELDAAYHPDIFESTLGTEFSAHGYSGILESDEPDAAIIKFWAGVSCIMR